MGSGEPLQEFTALGTITGKAPYQVEMSPDFRPWRLDVAFQAVTPAPIRPLLEELSFITDTVGGASRSGADCSRSRSPTWSIIRRALTRRLATLRHANVAVVT